MNITLEVCVDSFASARAAIRGGADRLELCSALALGGLTPYAALLRQIREESSIPVRCLMRPRSGDFLYSTDELTLLAEQIRELKDAGADGFVIGCLCPDGTLDQHALLPLLRAAGSTCLTLHRAIDVSADPLQTYRDAAKLGFDTVLTSGAASTCQEGIDTIRKLFALKKEINGPEILIGAGVDADIIKQFRKEITDSCAFHMSGKCLLQSNMIFRRDNVPMGIPGLDEWSIAQTSEEAIRAAKTALQESI